MVFLEENNVGEHPSATGEGGRAIYRATAIAEPSQTGTDSNEINYDGTGRFKPSYVSVEITWNWLWNNSTCTCPT